jgi:hypothetical protein
MRFYAHVEWNPTFIGAIRAELVEKGETRFYVLYSLRGSRDSVAGIATGYGLDDGGVGARVPVASRIFFSPRHPDRLWGPPSLLSNGYGALSPRGKAAGA